MSEGFPAAHHLDMVLQLHKGKVEDFLDDVFHFLATSTDLYLGLQSNKSAIEGVTEKFQKYQKVGVEPSEKRRKVETDILQVPTNEVQSVNEPVASDGDSGLIEILEMRRKNMQRSKQYFPRNLSFLLDRKYPTIYSVEKPRVDIAIDNDPWIIFLPPNYDWEFEIEDGVVKAFETKENKASGRWKNFEYYDRDNFVQNMQVLCEITENKNWIAYCKGRLDKLICAYEKYQKDSGMQELAEQEKIAKDFYTVIKVDTHLHAAGCCTMVRFLNFIRKKFLHNGADIVFKDAEGNFLTLKEVFELENLREENLNIEKLNVHADSKTFKNFDLFNDKFKPFGSKILRKIFLKSENDNEGKYFAEMIKEVIISDFNDKSYQAAEIRLTIYGKNLEEWSNLAKWAKVNDLYSKKVRWIIQIPRIFNHIKVDKPNHSFEDILKNIFMPLFDVTSNPDKDPYLHAFLKYVVGIDCVDDESDITDRTFQKDAVTPKNWIQNKNPPYSYYMYYLYSNISILNQFRRERGLSVMSLRPHCGEAGPTHHLATGFLLAESISHGVLLEKVPVLEYLYYLCNIGIGMALLSNSYLFVRYEDTPFPKYLYQGLNVSLSTDDPLIFHLTETPLMEEFSKAFHTFTLSPAELCELARNSVLISGFDKEIKEEWVGRSYKKEKDQEDSKKSNVPRIRDAYRYKKLEEELSVIFK